MLPRQDYVEVCVMTRLLPRPQKATASAPTFCGQGYNRDVVPRASFAVDNKTFTKYT